jgi:hypothetical protein
MSFPRKQYTDPTDRGKSLPKHHILAELVAFALAVH